MKTQFKMQNAKCKIIDLGWTFKELRIRNYELGIEEIKIQNSKFKIAEKEAPLDAVDYRIFFKSTLALAKVENPKTKILNWKSADRNPKSMKGGN